MPSTVDRVASEPAGRTPARPAARPVYGVTCPQGLPDTASVLRRERAPAFRGGGGPLLIFGVVLPTITILVELASGICAGAFFDPMPTAWHVLLALSVPAANAAVWFALNAASRGDTPRHLLPLGLLNGVAIAGGAYFGFLFLPVLPLALFALILFGMGLLPMGPMFGFVGALRARYRLGEMTQAAGRKAPGLWRGLALGALVVTCLVVPGLVTNYGLRMAASEYPGAREDGISLLRRFGSEQRLLEACYERGRREFGNPWDAIGTRVSAVEAQKVFYRVTGRPFESMPNPVRQSRALGSRPSQWDDEELLGRESVGTLLPGLSVASSGMTGSVNADAATAYFEWTMVFRNDQSFAQEARTRIALPRGGCVSRLTLWINGEECEAAWGGKAQVRQAYEQVVRVQRRDPVLVTSSGIDRVLMQCFPVPPRGTMKVRVGVTAPLELAAADRGEVILPRLLDRNFAIDGNTPHAVRIESKALLAWSGNSDAMPRGASSRGAGRRGISRGSDASFPAEGLSGRQASGRDDGFSGGGGTVLEGEVADARLSARVKVTVTRDPGAKVVWFDDSFDKLGMTVVQTVGAVTPRPTSRVVLALDGSAPMRPAIDAVADALAVLPAGVKVTALLSTDGGATRVEAASERPADVAAALRSVRCVGGQDGAPLLARALEVAAREPGAVVLWVHGPQALELGPTGWLAGQLEGLGAAAPAVTELQVGQGRNVVVDVLGEVTPAEAVEASADTRADLRGLFARRGDVQVVRLWARNEVARLCATRLAQSRLAAVDLAVSHQLVTPVSGAVVLESKSQYDAAGLTPVAAVPLPAGVWAALITAPFAWLAWRRARRAAAGS